MAQQHTFVVVKTERCPYCHQTMQFLSAIAQERADVRIATLDADGRPDAFAQIRMRTRQSTVPQIFLDGRFVGGWTELAAMAKRGELDAYLDGQDWAPEPAARRRLFSWPWHRR